jgi:hypothetical protein
MSSLLLFNPKDQPYGLLSPLSDQIISKSYTELIKDIPLKKSIQREDEKNARIYSLEIFEKVQYEKYQSFLKKGLDIKYREDVARKDLLSIPNKIIIYESKNDLLGMHLEGGSYVGSNFIGKYLMELCKKYKAEEKEQHQFFINKVYSVYHTLKAEIVNGENNLENYINKTIDEIIAIRILENNPIQLLNFADEQEIAYFLAVPESLATILRSCYANDYNISLKQKVNEEIKDQLILFYLDKTLQVSGEMLKKVIMHLYKENHILSLKDRLFRLYNLGLMKEFVFLKETKDLVVDENDCKQFMEYKVEKEDKKENNELYIIREDNMHSPFYDMMMKDKNFYFNVHQYAIKHLLESIDVPKDKAYHKIKNPDDDRLFLSDQELGKVYEFYKNKYVYETVTHKAKELLDSKYKQKFDYQLLLSTRTKYKDIIFNDKEDLILGDHFNFIGKYLVEKRQQLYEMYGDVDYKMFVKIEKENKLDELLKDEKIRKFSLQKTKDLYQMLLSFKNNVGSYTDIESFQFIFKNFLDCIHQIKFDDFDKSSVPIEFKRMFSVTKDCVEELWMYCYYIYKISLKLQKDIPIFALMEKNRKVKSLTSLEGVSLLPFDNFNMLARQSKIQPSKSVKSGHFDERLLKEKTTIDFRRFHTTEESQYSSLLPKHVKPVEEVFKRWFDINENKVIVDATAHIGVDTIHFSTIFPKSKIHSYEINPDTFELLQQNIVEFNKTKQIKAFNSSFLNASLDQSYFVYIDAPWGGRDYKNVPIGKFELYLDKMNIKEIARLLLVTEKTKTVVLKVPFNYNFSDLTHFIVERADIKDNGKTSFVLLKLSMDEKELRIPLLRSLCVSAFLNIFDTIKMFQPDFILNENTLHFAFQLLYLSNEKVKLNKDLKYNFHYQEMILPFIPIENQKHQELIDLTLIFQQYIEYIIRNPIKVENIISRILLFKSSKKVTFKQSMREQEEPLYEMEGEMEEEEEKFNFEDDDEEEEEEDVEEELETGADYDAEEHEDEYGNEFDFE